MRYTNVPLPTPVVQKIDRFIAEEKNGFRSRPDFILHHIRIALDKLEETNGDRVSEVWEK
ncbi:ribbon-helix-helix domain-containing protein [Candidatus Woesearchaeota archaeon]|nr:ribbon-helix-helix domain-containing protein [Candidatus Woesearchaeota archaeon]MBW3021598.1 ribbon-helix-helix domain-containing protein [Candidatus Woesearchaeota archaeon]